MRLFAWLFRAFIFFTLFAFALNNQQPATVHWFFGAEWRAPLVIVVLAAFAAGCAVGVVSMLPGWWRHWRAASRKAAAPTPAPLPAPATAPPSDFGAEHPPREGV
ncbi:MAG: LapA family protein [Rubrivivax sp.]